MATHPDNGRVRIVGLDPGLRYTGWGCIEVSGNEISYGGHGVISVPVLDSVSERLAILFQSLHQILSDLQPHEVAIEEVFVNRNGASTMKLCMARGVVLLAPAVLKIPVFEYGANCIKKTITGSGHATKVQIQTMVSFLLPPFRQSSSSSRMDCSDALAAALCHAQHRPLSTAIPSSSLRAVGM